jgi:hypothetical protein
MDSLRRMYFGRKAVRKILIDILIVIISSVLVFWVLPQGVSFFSLASVHQTFAQKGIHTLIACFFVLVIRILMRVYKHPWGSAKLLSHLNIVVADVLAGLSYYLFTKLAIGSVYPFLLAFALFALIDIQSLFLRLLHQGLIEDFIELFKKYD